MASLEMEDVLPPPNVANCRNFRVPMARHNFGTKGQKIPLLTNHLKVEVKNVDGHLFHYTVGIFYEDGLIVDPKGVRQRVINKVYNDFAGKDFAYDGEKTLFTTVGPLLGDQNKVLDFFVVLDDVSSDRFRTNGNQSSNDQKRLRHQYQSKTFKVEISFGTKIPMQAISSCLHGQESDYSQEALRFLDVMLRQHHASTPGCQIICQSVFHNDSKDSTDVVNGLPLSKDVSTTMIIKPRPVVEILMANQGVKDPLSLDWEKAKHALKNLRIQVIPSNAEYKITGLSEKPCGEQKFTLKHRSGRDGNNEDQPLEVTVYDYFVNHHGIDLQHSKNLPCINVGKPKRPIFFPLELCSLVSLQHYTKAPTTFQRVLLVEKSRQKKPHEQTTVLSNALKLGNYDAEAEPMLLSCGIAISSNFTQVEGRVLPAPKLKAGNEEDVVPKNGKWNFDNKKFLRPSRIEKWAVVDFSARSDIQCLVQNIIKCGEKMGILMNPPLNVFKEDQNLRCAQPMLRVEKMFDSIMAMYHCEEIFDSVMGMYRWTELPDFFLCLLPERKNCDLYGAWKRMSLSKYKVISQCIASPKFNDHYLTNVLLKINAKLGGLNSSLALERSNMIPVVSEKLTMILGMSVSNGSFGQLVIPSIAAVVSSREWPLISHYKASVRTQSPKVEMIDLLFDRVSKYDNNGIMRELLLDFYTSSGNRKPEQIIIFRNGVGESQFNQVLNIELGQIIEACKFLDEDWVPKFVVIIAQKSHRTKFFQQSSPHNVPPGTIIDDKTICHPRNNDFFLYAHAGINETTRPMHYHVLLDEVGFSADDLQELVHSLSYVYQTSTTAISVVAPIRYAQLAASQMAHLMKFEDCSEASSSHVGLTSAADPPVPRLPQLCLKLRQSMFFC